MFRGCKWCVAAAGLLLPISVHRRAYLPVPPEPALIHLKLSRDSVGFSSTIDALAGVAGVVPQPLAQRPSMADSAVLPAVSWYGELAEDEAGMQLRLCDPQGGCTRLSGADDAALVGAVGAHLGREVRAISLRTADLAVEALAAGDCAVAWERWQRVGTDPRFDLAQARTARCLGELSFARERLTALSAWAGGEPVVIAEEAHLAEGAGLAALLEDLQALTEEPAPVRQRIELLIDAGDFEAALRLTGELARRGEVHDAAGLQAALQAELRPGRQATLASLDAGQATLDAVIEEAEVLMTALARVQNHLAGLRGCGEKADLQAREAVLLEAAADAVAAVDRALQPVRRAARAETVEPLLTPTRRESYRALLRRARAVTQQHEVAALWHDSQRDCRGSLAVGAGLPGPETEAVVVLTVGEGVMCPGDQPVEPVMVVGQEACIASRTCDCFYEPVATAAVLGL